MGNFLRELLRAVDSFLSWVMQGVGKGVKIVTAFALGWPIVLMVLATFIPHENAVWAIPWLGFIPIIVGIEIVMRTDPFRLGITTTLLFLFEKTEGGHNVFQNAIRRLKILIWWNFFLTAYLALLPLQGRYIGLALLAFFLIFLPAYDQKVMKTSGLLVGIVIVCFIAWSSISAETNDKVVSAAEGAVSSAKELVVRPPDPPPCPRLEPHNLTSAFTTPAPVTVHLQAECLHGPLTLPPNTWLDRKLTPGSWIAGKCKGDEHVSKSIKYAPDQDGNLGNIMTYEDKQGHARPCTEVFLLGQGDLELSLDPTK
jgi:hypothetical protein